MLTTALIPIQFFVKYILLKNGHNSQNYRIIIEKTLIAEFVFI